MKNIFLLLAIISFISCQEEKPKKIVFNTNLQCRKADSRDYRIGQPIITMKKSKLLKQNPLKTLEQKP
jgi:GTP cyclohydrolase II